MICLTKIKGEVLWVNPDLIESISASPDTVIALSNGKTIMVKESPEEIKNLIVAYRKEILEGPKIIRDSES